MPSPETGEVANRDSWKTLPPPIERADLGYSCHYTGIELARLKRGLIPEDMDDKWFIFFEEPWLYLHRSWTGACIYGLRLEPTPRGATVAESWVTRDPDHYKLSPLDYERALLAFLIDALLLGKDTPFPVPSSLPEATAPGLFQHAVVGRAHPEVILPAEPSADEDAQD